MIRATRTAFTVAAALVVGSVVLGAMVCATEASAACPNWPGCYPGQFAPEPSLRPMVEFIHRVVSGATGPAVLVAALLGRKLADPLPRRLAWIGLAGTLSAGMFGMLIVLVGIPWWLGMLDLASALAATVCMLLARVLLIPSVEWAPGRLARLAWAAVGVLAAMHLSAIAVAGPNSFTRCLSWPLGVLDADRWSLLQGLRIGLAVAAAVLIGITVVRAVSRPGDRVLGWLVAALLTAELGLGGLLLLGIGDLLVRTGYAIVAALLFSGVALLAGRASVQRVVEPAAARSVTTG